MPVASYAGKAVKRSFRHGEEDMGGKRIVKKGA